MKEGVVLQSFKKDGRTCILVWVWFVGINQLAKRGEGYMVLRLTQFRIGIGQRKVCSDPG